MEFKEPIWIDLLRVDSKLNILSDITCHLMEMLRSLKIPLIPSFYINKDLLIFKIVYCLFIIHSVNIITVSCNQNIYFNISN